MFSKFVFPLFPKRGIGNGGFAEGSVVGKGRLSAWLIADNRWRLYLPSGSPSPSADTLRVFKSLAREAAKGLGVETGSGSWTKWLELLSCAEDEDTGKRHYNMMEGSSYSSQTGRQSPTTEEQSPRGSLTEFRLTANSVIEKGRRW